ncbi:MAG TPA: gliding motility-associated C-terminal domain-containing protein, partial [Cytophagaceae bacterium]|nr:gliding motility-associated C-terminal domain-containing protein [Cytophagaceae bacterium]
SDIPNLTYMKITSNFFENFPDLTSFPKLSELYVDSNALSFDDIIPNCSIPNLTYLYTPQHANVPDLPEIYLKASEPFTLQISVGGIGNLYQWQSNFSNVSESNHCFGTQTYKIINTASEIGDGGFYSCLVTNPAAPLLTIQVESNRVEVADNRLSQTITFHNADTMYCGDTLQLNATSSSGLPVYYKLANGDSLTNRFAPQGNNSYVIVAYSDGDSIYQPASTTLNVHVLTHSPIPVFAIANDLPIYEGEELSLSVQDVPGVSYRWTLPNATYSFNDSIMIPSVTSSDQGWYTVSIYQGSCVFDTLRIDVELAVDTDLVIYELITPNGDGDNETFYIKNIEKTPPVQVTVFDVWHQVVYSKDNYQNDWNGGGLPVGTYYYLAKVDKWNKVYKGNLYIKR